MSDEEIQIAKRGIRIWFEEEFAEIEARHKKEINMKNIELDKKDAELDKKDAELRKIESQFKMRLAEKDELHSIELAEKDKKIAELNEIIQAKGII